MLTRYWLASFDHREDFQPQVATPLVHEVASVGPISCGLENAGTLNYAQQKSFKLTTAQQELNVLPLLLVAVEWLRP